jgi:hypothetical protein
MSIRPAAVLALACATASAGAAQQHPADRYASQPFVIEKQYQTLNFKPDGTGTRELFVRVRVQSEAGLQAFGQLAMSYSSANQDLSIDSVVVFKAGGGAPVLAPASAVQDLNAPIANEAPMYSDLRMKVITVPSLRPGDTLQYRVRWTTRTAFAPGYFWESVGFPRDGIILDSRLTLIVPRGTFVNAHTTGVPDPAVQDSAGSRVWHWRTANLEADTTEPARRQVREKQTHVVNISNFRSWEDVGRW